MFKVLSICLSIYVSMYLPILQSFLPSSGLINSSAVDTLNIILLSNLMLLICIKITEDKKKSFNYLTCS